MWYRLVDKYMRQPHVLSSGLRISRKLIYRVWIFRKIKIDQIDFEYAIYAIIIFSFCTLKSVKGMFRMEYDQRVIIKFLLNEETDARDIADRMQAQFGEHA
jgi:hypothetical protein